MQVGPYEIDEGVVIVVGFLGLVTLLLLWTWYKNSQTSSDLKGFAKLNGWLWAGSAPKALKAALVQLQDTAHPWKTSNVIAVPQSGGMVFLLNFQRRISGSDSSSITSDGMACLVPGRVGANTPFFSLERMPLKLVASYLEMAGDPLDDVGSPAFHEKFLIQSSGLAHRGQDDGAGLAKVEISPGLETEMLRWHQPLGQTQAWSKVFIRDQLVLVTRNRTGDMSHDDWRALLDMGESVSRARREAA